MLGKTVLDRLSGFRGTVTGEVLYITGCRQCLIQPFSEEGKKMEPEWVDKMRLEVTGDSPIKANNDEVGFDKQPNK
ncbi:MAG: hypothetical protein GY804_09865 [Alphaproteobacteria bacterium]|nr:hypothetical protein [Alphaproteobacteria bacterium]